MGALSGMDSPLAVHGYVLDTAADRFGELRDSSSLLEDPTALCDRYVLDGYLFIRGLVHPDTVLAARRELLLKYAVLGEVDGSQPLMDAAAGTRAGLGSADMRAFTESVRTGARYEAVILDRRLLAVVEVLLEGGVRPYDFRWPRLIRPGEGCGFHCDGPYMSRGTNRHLSAWIPLGSVEPRGSALMLLEDSHNSEELRSGYLQLDADKDELVWLDDDPAVVQDLYGKRWLSATFEPGDVLLFNMSMLHGAFDNMTDNCRLSTDSRYLAAGEVPDARWNGDDIQPHGVGRVFYPGLGSWDNADFQDEWKYVDERGRLIGLGTNGGVK